MNADRRLAALEARVAPQLGNYSVQLVTSRAGHVADIEAARELAKASGFTPAHADAGMVAVVHLVGVAAPCS